MRPTTSIEELPDPIIEYILSYLSPYTDLKQCMQVNKAWYRYVYDVVRKTQTNFFNAVCRMSVEWCHLKIRFFTNPAYDVYRKTPREHRNTKLIALFDRYEWEDVWHCRRRPAVTNRYSHSACSSANSMYMFGGCNAHTTFNDLLRLDLGTRRWFRPPATGAHPPSMAFATLVRHCDYLVLFGGWTHTVPYPLPQHVWRVFNKIHVYNTVTDIWTQITSATTCPPRAGHSATVHGDFMVVFGGACRIQARSGPIQSSNDVWTLDLKSYKWQKETIVTDSPPPRYGHSQIIIDKNNLLIMGGCGGPNMFYTDIWLLKMVDGPGGMWKWEKMNILSKENGAPLLAFHPACKVGSQVVVLGKAQKSRTPPSSLPHLLRAPSRICVPPRPNVGNRIISVTNAKRPISEVEPCVNGRGGVCKRPAVRKNLEASHMSSSDEDESQNASNKAPFNVVLNSFPLPSQNSALQQSNSQDSSPSTSGYHQNTAGNLNSSINCAMSKDNSVNRGNSDSAGPSRSDSSWEGLRQKFLDPVEMLNNQISGKRPMCLHVLDISTAVQGTVTWRTLKNQSQLAPDEMILYSLVLGKGEIIMFGGIQKDLNSRQLERETIPEVISNSLHFMTAEHFVI